jgi:hypothetical protein
MQSPIAHIPRVTSTGNQRVPRKSSSFLSLRLQRDKSPASEPHRSSGPPPSALLRSTYFDAYPASASTRSSNSRARKASLTRTDPDPCHEPFSSQSRTWKDKDRREDSSPELSFAFPSLDPSEDPASFPGLDKLTPKPYIRTRSRTGPSRKSNWSDSSPIPIPSLRFSGSSTRTYFDTPLHTPIDNTSLKNFHVLVAAPISGVETMDALVDGMNGGDDILGHMSSRSRFGIPGHHPLYQPPLPTPPPGVVLGGGKQSRKQQKPCTSSESDADDDEDPPPKATPPRTPRRRAPRPTPSRTPSASTVVASPPPSQPESDEEDPPQLNHIPEIPSPQSTISSIDEKPKVVPPSISEIIRTHAPPAAQVRTRLPTPRSSLYTPSNGHTTVFEEPESEPEPLTADEEAELLSRSSIDSIADEVRRTVHRQNTLRIATPPIHVSYTAPTNPNRHSIVVSDTASYRSPRSEAGTERASIYSSSISHNHHSFESPSLMAFSRPTPSQAVAQYLRSARLTTLLKLTRSPHASQDNPLLVSLSDLGSATGFPLVVFLGLGCVRHIMGLYDEMAECLGLRLITIDR